MNTFPASVTSGICESSEKGARGITTADVVAVRRGQHESERERYMGVWGVESCGTIQAPPPEQKQKHTQNRLCAEDWCRDYLLAGCIKSAPPRPKLRVGRYPW